MQPQKKYFSRLLFFFLIIILVGIACQQTAQPPANDQPQENLEATIAALQTQMNTNPAVTQIPEVVETQVAEAPVITATIPAENKQPDIPTSDMYPGFYVYQPGIFKAYDFNGNPLGIEFVAGLSTWYGENEFTGFMDEVYYSEFIQGSGVFRVDGYGRHQLNFIQSSDPVYMAVSLDRQHIAWSTSHWGTDAVSTEIFISNLDGSNMQKVDSLGEDGDNDQYLVYYPVKWLADGRLVYATGPTGIGGYILFWGYNGLFVYNPANGSIRTLVDIQEGLGLCLSSFSDQLDKVAITCGDGSPTVRVRNLSNGLDTKFPILPDQNSAGSVRFSPSGEWLAYVIQTSDPDQEYGQVVVAPADGSQAPVVVAAEKKSVFKIGGWLNEDDFLVTVTNMEKDISHVLKIAKDGSRVSQVVSGMFLDFIH